MQSSKEVPIKGESSLYVKAITWTRDSHGLFDYETFHLIKNTLSITSDCTLIRSGKEVRVLSSDQYEPYEEIGKIQIQDGKCTHL